MTDTYYQSVKFKCLHSDCGVLASQEWCTQNDLASELVHELYDLFSAQKIRMNTHKINCVEGFLAFTVDDFAETVKSFFLRLFHLQNVVHVKSIQFGITQKRFTR